jgi:signal transduction histidine kinase
VRLRLGLLLVLAGGSAGWPVARAVPVGLRAVEASAADQEFPLSAAVDGIATTNNGWRISGAVFQEQFAVFVPDKPLSAALCQFQFSFRSGLPNAHFGDFEIDVTTDEAPAVQGRWAPLIPESAVADCAEGVRAFGTTTRIETHCPVTVVTLRARVPFNGITGFRLRLFPNAPDPQGKRRSAIGRAPAGDFLLTEFRVETDPQRSSNIALGRQPYCSRAVAAGLPSRNLTDGFFSTYSHPDSRVTDPNGLFELDLGQMTTLDHITLRGREDGPAADRLAAFRVELLTEAGGFPGQTQWQSRPANETPLPLGVAAIVRAGDGDGTFVGRRIRLHNQSTQNNQPLLAELEVYPALFPRAQDWLADDRVLQSGAEVTVPAGAKKLRLTIVCGEFPQFSDMVMYRWRLAGWRDEWQEADREGRVVISPVPPGGLFKLELQARHSDGIWDESGVPAVLRIALPWWRNPTLLTTVILVALVLTAAIWWRVKATVMKRRLVLAEQHLDLHRERLRIARDMHDEMGARLTYIALLADRTRREANGQSPGQAEQLAELADSARSSVTALDAIVWAVNPQHDSVGDLADYLSDYAPGYLKPAGIECRLDLHLENPKQTLSLSLRHALLMAVKEALQNVLRHAEARAVRVKLREAQGQLEVTVTDDGRGFDQPAAGVSHSGLENMRQRLAEIGGVCHIGPGENGRGVCVRFAMPVTSTK